MRAFWAAAAAASTFLLLASTGARAADYPGGYGAYGDRAYPLAEPYYPAPNPEGYDNGPPSYRLHTRYPPRYGYQYPYFQEWHVVGAERPYRPHRPYRRPYHHKHSCRCR